ncbi:MAG: hypothetical protein ABI944_06810 [Chthoniobacterales bacterium]
MKRFLAVFVLTPREQVVVIVLLIIFIAATLITRWHDTPALPSSPAVSAPGN